MQQAVSRADERPDRETAVAETVGRAAETDDYMYMYATCTVQY